MWWPEIDKQIKEKVKSCNACQTNRNTPKLATLHPWEWPDKSWSHIYVDYAGPFLNHMFLFIIDVYSKWLEIHIRYVHNHSASTAAVTIQKLQQTIPM